MIRCLIVDDKPLAIDILKEYAARIPFLQLVYTTQNPLDALEYLRVNPVDLVFLDIQMPELNGIQFMRILNGSCKVILTTAYSEYALEGYEHDVIDYLLKPVSFERFYKAVDKVRDLPLKRQPEFGVASSQQENNHSLFVRTGYRIQRIDFQTILFIEAKQNYVSIVTGAASVMSLQSISSIEEKLPAALFMRVHKSYIVALEKIDTVEKSRIFIGTASIPIGESYRDAFFARLGS